MELVQAARSFHIDYPSSPYLHLLSAAEMSQVGIPPPNYKDQSVFPGQMKSIHTDFMSDISAPAWRLGTWDSFLDEVNHFVQHLPDTGSYLRAEAVHEICDKYDMQSDLREQLTYLGSNLICYSARSVLGEPDVCVEWDKQDFSGHPGLLVGVVELDILPPLSPDQIQEELLSSPACEFWPVLNRLREFMGLLQAGPMRFGFLTTRKWYWFCYGDRDMLALSAPVEAEKVNLACFWYLMALSEVKEEMATQRASALWWNVGRQPDFTSLKSSMEAMVEALAEEISGEKKNIHKHLQFWTCEQLQLGAKIWKRRCDGMLATLKGQEVVVKIRDLGNRCSTVQGEMKMFVREILMYRKLKSIQGIVIPKLHGYGFMSGGMFAVLVLSYVGRTEDFFFLAPELRQRYGEAAVRGLKTIHDFGIAHGEIDLNCMLVKGERLSFVGLSKAGPPRKARAFRREMEQVKTIFGMDEDDSDDDDDDDDE